MRPMRWSVAIAAVLALLCAGRAEALRFYAVSVGPTEARLLRFDSAATSMVQAVRLPEQVLAIDVNPTDGYLYGLTQKGHVVRIDPDTGAFRKPDGTPGQGAQVAQWTIPGGIAPSELLGWDFDPGVPVDQRDWPHYIRMPRTAAAATIKNAIVTLNGIGYNGGDWTYAPGQSPGGTALVAAIAHTQSRFGAGTATPYVIDVNSPAAPELARVGLVNSATVAVLGNRVPISLPPGGVFGSHQSLDADPDTDVLYLYEGDGGASHRLYRLDLSGAATLVGELASTVGEVTDIAVAPPGELRVTVNAMDLTEGQPGQLRAERLVGTFGTVDATWRIAEGTARAGRDYVLPNAAVHWADLQGGTLSRTLQTIANTACDGDRTLTATLVPAPGTIARATRTTVFVHDDEPNGPPGVARADAGAVAGREGAGPVNVRLTRSGGSCGTLTLSYALHAVSATAGTDFTDTRGTVTFAAGQTERTVSVPVIDDAVDEADETLALDFADPIPAGALGSPSSVAVTILDDDEPPTVIVEPPIVLPRADADGDGVLAPADCNDADASIRPGATDTPGNRVDEDCSGTDAPYPRIVAAVRYSFVPARRGTRIVSLTVSDVPAQATISLTCRGGGCPKARKPRKVPLGSRLVNLSARLKRAVLRPRAVLEIRILAPDRIGKVVRLTMRARRSPRAATLCLVPGVKRPASCG